MYDIQIRALARLIYRKKKNINEIEIGQREEVRECVIDTYGYIFTPIAVDQPVEEPANA